MMNIFPELKNMNHQLSSVYVLAIMFQLCLAVFLHLDTYVLESAQKAVLYAVHIYHSGFTTPNFDFIRSNETVEGSFKDVSHCLRTSKGHMFSV